MNHPWHEHPMRMKGDEADPFECSGCKELGFGPRYQCAMNCDFFLHEDCLKARPIDGFRIHLFMGSCRFQFLWEPPGGPNRRWCDACGGNIGGFMYHDQSEHKHDLHPCCMNLKMSMSDPYNRMTLILKDKMPSKCVKCKKKNLKVQSKRRFRGWSYVSSCGNYCFHVYCVKKLILDIWENGHSNVGSSPSSLSSRGETTASSSRSMGRPSHRNSTTSATSSSAIARRRPVMSFFTRGLIKFAKMGFSVIISIRFGDPTPLFTSVAENLRN